MVVRAVKAQRDCHDLHAWRACVNPSSCTVCVHRLLFIRVEGHLLRPIITQYIPWRLRQQPAHFEIRCRAEECRSRLLDWWGHGFGHVAGSSIF